MSIYSLQIHYDFNHIKAKPRQRVSMIGHFIGSLNNQQWISFIRIGNDGVIEMIETLAKSN